MKQQFFLTLMVFGMSVAHAEVMREEYNAQLATMKMRLAQDLSIEKENQRLITVLAKANIPIVSGEIESRNRLTFYVRRSDTKQVCQVSNGRLLNMGPQVGLARNIARMDCPDAIFIMTEDGNDAVTINPIAPSACLACPRPPVPGAYSIY